MSLPIPIKFRTIESLKFLLLNVCAHDPWHDFESGARTYDKEDKIGGKIAKDMNDLYILCNRIDQRRSTISGGAGEAEEQGQEYERLNNIGEQLIEKLVDLEKTSVLPGNAGVEELKESEDSDSESIDISSFKTVAEIKNILKKRSIQLTDDFVGMVTNQVFLPIIKFSINIIIESQQKDEISNVENQIDSEVLSDEVPPGDEVPRVEVPPGDEDNDDDSDSEEPPLVTKEQIERENLQSEEIIQKQQEIVELLSSQEESIIEPSQILSLENLYSYIDSTTDLESTMNDDKYNSLRVRTDANRETTISNIFQKQENLESLKNPILFESCLNELKKVDSVYKGLSDNIEIDGHEVEVDDQEKTQKYLLTQDEKMSESSSESYVSIIKDFLDNTIKPLDQSAAEAKQDEEYDSKKLFNTILKAENILKKTLLKPIIECIENLDRQDINVEKSSIFKLNDIILLFIDAKKHLKVGEYLNFFPNSLNEMNQLDADDQIDLLKKMKRKLLTIVHTDHANLNKQACSGEPDKSYCEKLFKKLLKININSLFATDNEGTDEGAAAQQDEEGKKMEGGAKRKDRLYSDLPEINKIILSKQTEFIMKWLNLLNLTNSTEMKGLEDFNFASALFINPDRYPELKQFMGLQPSAQIKGSISGQAQKDKFQKIEQLMIDKKKKAYRDLIKPLYVWIKPEGETGRYVNLGYCIPSHFILNAQLLILGSKINFYKQGSFKILEFINNSKSISTSATKYNISAIEILGPLSFSEYNSWTDGKKNIDDQLQEMMNIIITYIGFEDPSNFEFDEDKMKNESGYNKQIFSDQAGERFPKKIGEKEFFGERFDFPNTDKQFIVNNASSFSKILTFGGLTKDKISKKVFCPIASILDAMKNCSISSALKNKTCILNPMNFEISDSSNNITYNISYITPKSNSCPNLSAYEKQKGFIILSISLSKLINTDSNPDSSSSPIIFNKCIPYSGSQLSATLAYKDIISNFYKAYTTISSSPEVRSTRFANSLILESKFVPIINFIDSVIADVFQNTIVKSIGDYAQEGVVSSKFSALEDLIQKSSLSPTILSSISSNKNNLEGDSFRVGVANDRPSAYRMIYTSLFATKNSKNHGAIVGYYGPETSNKNFMVFPKIPNIYQIESPESIRKVTQGSLDNRYKIFLDYLVSSENISKLTSSSTPPTAGGGTYKTKKRKRTRKRKNKSTKKKKNKKNKKSKNRKNKKRNSLKK